jgi:hypothetical protein
MNIGANMTPNQASKQDKEVTDPKTRALILAVRQAAVIVANAASRFLDLPEYVQTNK